MEQQWVEKDPLSIDLGTNMKKITLKGLNTREPVVRTFRTITKSKDYHDFVIYQDDTIDVDWFDKQYSFVMSLTPREVDILRSLTGKDVDKLLNAYLRENAGPSQLMEFMNVVKSPRPNVYGVMLPPIEIFKPMKLDEVKESNIVSLVKKYIEEVDAIFKKAPATTKPLRLFRGIKAPEKTSFRPITGYTSTSYAPMDYPFDKFTGKCCMFDIVVSPGVQAICIEPISDYPNEREVILPPNIESKLVGTNPKLVFNFERNKTRVIETFDVTVTSAVPTKETTIRFREDVPLESPERTYHKTKTIKGSVSELPKAKKNLSQASRCDTEVRKWMHIEEVTNLKNVLPEDIERLKAKLRPYFTEEQIVKCINKYKMDTGKGYKNLNVILDIDETFVQYVGIDDWASVPEAEKAKYKIAGGGEGKNGLFILRPKFNEFFEYLNEQCATINLWTWSDEEYADGVKQIIESTTPAKITNVWVDTDVEESIKLYGHNKDLNYIWYIKNMFMPCDTILIDDLKENTQHSSNIKNGIQLKEFAPLGKKLGKSEKTKTKIRKGPYVDMSQDDTLTKVITVLEKVITNPDFCKEGDLPFPFSTSTTVLGGRRKTYRKRKLNRKTRKYRR